MGKRDPFVKDSEAGDPASMKEEVIDFGDSGDGSGRSNKTKIIAGVLVLGALVGVGAYFLVMQNEEPGLVVSSETNAHKIAATKKELPKTTAMTAPPKSEAYPHKAESAMAAPASQAAMPVKPEPMPEAPMVAASNAGPAKILPTTTKEAPQVKATPQKAMKAQKASMANEDEDEDSDQETAAFAPSLLTPEHGATRSYDETSNMAPFTWSGSGRAWITFSRSPKMHPIEVKAPVNGNHFEFVRPHPGIWYWQVANARGKSEVRMFTINPPLKRAIALLNVQDGAALTKDNATIAWKGDSMVTYYRVEVSNQGWANPSFRFATTGTQLEMHGVPQGQYQIRVGAFSEVSGRWEYTDPMKVTVQ